MPTSDKNGLPRFVGGDNVAPLDTVLNLITAGTSTALDSNVRPFIVADATARSALASNRTPTKEQPLLVYRQDLGSFQINTGNGWESWPPPAPDVSARMTKAGRTSFGAVGKGAALQVPVTFGTTITPSAWTPTVTLQGTRGSVDRLYPTISAFTSTGMTVVVKNATTAASQGSNTLHWALIPVGV